jgi:hypothetical protein
MALLRLLLICFVTGFTCDLVTRNVYLGIGYGAAMIVLNERKTCVAANRVVGDFLERVWPERAVARPARPCSLRRRLNPGDAVLVVGDLADDAAERLAELLDGDDEPREP